MTDSHRAIDSDFREIPQFEEMIKLQQRDPALFDRTYSGALRAQMGFYISDKERRGLLHRGVR